MIASSLITLALVAANGVVAQRPTSVTVSASTTVVTSASVPATPSTTVSSAPTASPTSGTVNCNNAQNWQSALAYVAGAQAIFNNQLFTAKQWTYNNAPTTHSDQWTHVGTCAEPINNKANCGGISAWESNVAYTAGSKVTNQGHLWTAVQWAFANTPNDASGTWQDLGACS